MPFTTRCKTIWLLSRLLEADRLVESRLPQNALGLPGTTWSLPAAPLLNRFKNTLTLFGTCSISVIEHVQNALNYDIDQEG